MVYLYGRNIWFSGPSWALITAAPYIGEETQKMNSKAGRAGGRGLLNEIAKIAPPSEKMV